MLHYAKVLAKVTPIKSKGSRSARSATIVYRDATGIEIIGASRGEPGEKRVRSGNVIAGNGDSPAWSWSMLVQSAVPISAAKHDGQKKKRR